MHERAAVLVPAVYGVMFFSALNVLPSWGGLMGRTHLDWLWPVAWLHVVPAEMGILAILILSLLGTGAAMVVPGSRWARVAAMLGMVFFWAMNNSTGKIGHSLHVSVLLSILLVLLPSGWNRRKASRPMQLAVSHGVAGMQIVLLLTYTMAGLVKVGAGVVQLVAGQPSLFSLDSLSRHIADRLLQTGATSPVGELLINYSWLGGPFMWATVYLEFFALWAVFRPRLQVPFAIGLILFHIGSFFTMTIIFPQNCVLLGLLVAVGTGVRPTWSWRGFIEDLPGFGYLWRMFLRRNQPLPVAGENGRSLRFPG
ncbi:MAG: hypothetical protein OHK005_11540 [Candidatus Methylacidiphilales bacterium]